MTLRGEVLIVILNNLPDMEILRQQGWYRIPIEQVEKLKQQNHWPPKWLAFYLTKVFGEEAYCVAYYAQVIALKEVYRWELFPDEPTHAKSNKRYLKVELSALEKFALPLRSDRLRRVTFIPTTWEHLANAIDLSDVLK